MAVKKPSFLKPKEKDPVAEPKKAPVVPVAPVAEEYTGLRCACGKPVAPGQNQVCADHIRAK